MDENGRRALVLVVLIAAGEAVFLLPFVIPRVFRPTVLAVFGIDNTTLGFAFSVYGMVAMLAYGLGGPLADRFSVRWMLSLALFCTAIGGAVQVTIPSAGALIVLYGVWGVTTILLFWAGLIRATREWGRGRSEGAAFGLLDGGRGLFAAVLSTGAVVLFGLVAGEDEGLRTLGLQAVIGAAALITFATGVLLFVLVPEPGPGQRGGWDWGVLVEVAKRPSVWLQGVIVLCAYVGYKGTDDLSLLASDVLHYSDVEAAVVGTMAFWIRPMAALAAGFVADRVQAWKVVAVGFGLLVLGDLGVVLGAMQASVVVLFSSVVATCVAVYALRGVYFALLRDAAIPIHATGTAVGLVSVLGYTPDVFFGPMMGIVLDGSPGAPGHMNLFVLLTGFAAVGLVATLAFAWTCEAQEQAS